MALAGFALDSFIEIFASLVVVFQLKGIASEERESRAVRLIGVAFFGLALFVIFQSLVTLAAGIHPSRLLVGCASARAALPQNPPRPGRSKTTKDPNWMASPTIHVATPTSSQEVFP